MENVKSEAQKFFDSLPSETDEPDFNFFEKPDAAKVEPAGEEPVIPQPEKVEEEEEGKTLRNRNLRRDRENRYFQEQLRDRDERLLRLETQLMERESSPKENVDARLTRLFGDSPQGKEASLIVQQLLDETKNEATTPYKELLQERQQQESLTATLHSRIEKGIEDVEDSFGVDLSSRSARDARNAFIDFVADLSPENDLANFEKAWPAFLATQKAPKNPQTQERRKQIAGRSTVASSPARPDTGSLKPVSFMNLDGMWSKITGQN